MAKVFLDTNILIDLIEERKDLSGQFSHNENLFISPLSLHILLYVTKQNVPNEALSDLEEIFSLIPFDETICYKALVGPTNDFEDNVQLHSAAEADCDIFLTEDRKLLAMKFFGKVTLAKSL
jgi:predicted nucleic acid-binding protein